MALSDAYLKKGDYGKTIKKKKILLYFSLVMRNLPSFECEKIFQKIILKIDYLLLLACNKYDRGKNEVLKISNFVYSGRE